MRRLAATSHRPIVLIVDDDADIRDVIALVIERDGYEAVTAADGAEALAALRSFHPCLILLDLMMPVMDGWRFRRAQMEDSAWSAIPVVLLTGGGNVERHTRNLRVSAGLHKPVELDVLRRIVRSHCGEPSGT